MLSSRRADEAVRLTKNPVAHCRWIPGPEIVSVADFEIMTAEKRDSICLVI